MCDYSLEMYRARPAERDEKITLERFPSGSMGFTNGTDCNTAVCVPADTRLRLEGIGENVQRAHGIGPIEEVVMTRLETGPHKDGVIFSSGKEVSLQALNAGITAVVVAFTSDLTAIGGSDVKVSPRELLDA
jgi:hypothetical protein